MKITRFFMDRPLLFWSAVVMILIGGFLSFLQMPKLEDPAVCAKQAMVIVPYQGASSHEVELKVATVMEQELRSLPNIKKIKTECQSGVALFTVEYQLTVLLKDLEQNFDLLRRKVNSAATKLPQECITPIVVDDMMDVYGIFYALSGEGYDYPTLNKYAKYIQRELSAVKGVKRINVVGNRAEVINITLSKEQISRNGIIPTQIMSALQSAGKTVNAGKFLTDGDRISVYVDSAVKDENDIANLLIQTLDGKRLRLADIAKVEREYAQPQQNGLFVGGKPAIAICITMESNAIVPDVGKATDKRLAEIMHDVPVGFKAEKIYFQPDKVTSAIYSFLLNLLESVVIVIVILIFTMGIRSGLIIGFGLLLTVAVSFPILLTLGTTLQRISLGAFIIAMGMLVDNAVVIMDGILIDKRRGLSPDVYLYKIGKNTAMPLLGATIIAAATFVCVYLSPDSAGEYAHDLFLVLCVSLLASWVLALVQVPFCAARWLPKQDKNEDKPVMNSPMHHFIRRTLNFLIGYKKVTLITAFAVLAVCIFGMTRVKNLFFPDFDYNQFVAECFFPTTTDADEVRDKMLQMSDSLYKNPAIERVTISQGSAPAHYCLVRPMTSGGDCYAEFIIDCKDYKSVIENMSKIRKQLRAMAPDAYIRTRKYNFSISTTHSVEVQFAGPDPAVLKSLAEKAENIMRNCKYVDPYSVENNWRPMGKALTAKYIQPNGLRAGVERGDIANAILAATDGMPVGVINDSDEQILVNLKVRNEDGSRISSLTNIPVWSMMNAHLTNEELTAALGGGKAMSDLQDKVFRAVPLSSVTSGVELGWNEDVVLRCNGERVIEAECDPNGDIDGATPAKVVAEIEDQIEAIPLPEGYSLKWIGDGELQADAIGNLLKFVPITIVLILVVLLLLFNSWAKIFIMLLCFPFVFCGITPALLLTNQPFTFMAIIGLLGLIGMMVKNAIVLVDEIHRLETVEHEEPYRAVIEATVSRVRPVLMASLTTIVGMLPLVTDPMYASMAITIMGGLAVGTLITLILLPLLYTTIFRIKKPVE